MIHLGRCLRLRSTQSVLVNVAGALPTTFGMRKNSGLFRSREYNPDEKIDFEVSKDPEEWKYVARLLPPKMVPEPVAKSSYPSGWKPQSPDVVKGPYYVRRSRNHMIPVYFKVTHRGLKKTTTVRHIYGDIWLFAKDLHQYLQSKLPTVIGYKVDEVGCKVVLRGDFVYYTTQFLTEKGF